MMRTRVLAMVVLALALLGTPYGLWAQAGDEAAVAQAVEAFRNAMLKADKEQFAALTAEQLSYGHSAGRVEDKAQFIAAATSGQSTWKFITLSEQSNKIVGNTAIVRHTLTGETERDSKTTPVKIGVMMIWHKHDNQWKLLARQAFRFPEAATN